MKKQPTPVQGYDTQLHVPAASAELSTSGAASTSPNTGEHDLVKASPKRSVSDALGAIPIMDLQSGAVVTTALAGGGTAD